MAVADWVSPQTFNGLHVARLGEEWIDTLFALGHVDETEALKAFNEYADTVWDGEVHEPISGTVHHSWALEDGSDGEAHPIFVNAATPGAAPVTWIYLD